MVYRYEYIENYCIDIGNLTGPSNSPQHTTLDFPLPPDIVSSSLPIYTFLSFSYKNKYKKRRNYCLVAINLKGPNTS